MKRILIAFTLLGLCCIPALAQDYPKFEVFGGYQLVHEDGIQDIELEAFNYHGFTAAAEYNLTSYFGIVGEFGYFKHTENADEGTGTLSGTPFLFGPRVGYRGENLRFFAHYLLGGIRAKLDTTPDFEDVEFTETYFAQAIGAGLDLIINKYISIRPAQVDLLSIRATDAEGTADWENDFRYSAGVVFTFGK